MVTSFVLRKSSKSLFLQSPSVAKLRNHVFVLPGGGGIRIKKLRKSSDKKWPVFVGCFLMYVLSTPSFAKLRNRKVYPPVVEKSVASPQTPKHFRSHCIRAACILCFIVVVSLVPKEKLSCSFWECFFALFTAIPTRA